MKSIEFNWQMAILVSFLRRVLALFPNILKSILLVHSPSLKNELIIKCLRSRYDRRQETIRLIVYQLVEQTRQLNSRLNSIKRFICSDRAQ